MKKTIVMLTAGVCALLPLSGAETVYQADFQKTGGVQKRTHEANKWPASYYPVKLEKDAYYCVNCTARTLEVKNPKNYLSIGLNSLFVLDAPCCSEWNTFRIYCYNFKDQNSSQLRAGTCGPEVFKAEFKDLILTKLSAGDLKKIVLDFDGNNGSLPVNFSKRFWDKTDGDVSIVGSEDHVADGNALRIKAKIKAGQKKAAACVFSQRVPFVPGKKYQLSFWAKADRATPFTLWIDGYVHGQKKHWYSNHTMTLAGNWKKFTVNFTAPKVEDYPHLAGRTFYYSLNLPLEAQEKTACFKTFTLEMLD